MTLAPRRPSLPFTGLEDIAAALRERGSRLSAARRLVLESLFAAEGPVSAEWIADGLGGERTRLDVTSVYRGLERLEELGVVRHVHLGHGPGLYTLESEGHSEYLVCERCNRVDTVDGAQLDAVRERIRETFGYEARFSHFPIVASAGAAPRPETTARQPPRIRHGGRRTAKRTITTTETLTAIRTATSTATETACTRTRTPMRRAGSKSTVTGTEGLPVGAAVADKRLWRAYPRSMTETEHTHDEPHAHEHEHEEGTTHSHPHVSHDHEHVSHEHEHTHGDGTAHGHEHVHEEGLEHSHDEAHEHEH